MKTILVADDNKEQVEELIFYLKKKYIVEYVDDGKKAIERISKGGLDGVVLDWKMIPEGMNFKLEAINFYGDKVAINARKLYPHLPLVLRSSIAEDFVEPLKQYDIFCHSKYEGNQPILDYFKQELGE